jgi:hypothetical protein
MADAKVRELEANLATEGTNCKAGRRHSQGCVLTEKISKLLNFLFPQETYASI